MAQYIIYNGSMPTTAPFLAVTTGSAGITTPKTLLQLKTFNVAYIVEWGISFDGNPTTNAASAPVKCELIDTGQIFATVTTSVDADVMKFDGAEGAVASVAGLTLGTSATGFTSSGEGSITATKLYDAQWVSPLGGYVKQFPLGYRPKAIIGNSTRIRVATAVALNAVCYMVVEI